MSPPHFGSGVDLGLSSADASGEGPDQPAATPAPNASWPDGASMPVGPGYVCLSVDSAKLSLPEEMAAIPSSPDGAEYPAYSPGVSDPVVKQSSISAGTGPSQDSVDDKRLLYNIIYR